MSAVHGKDIYFMWNSVNLSPYAKTATFPRTADTAETTTFGSTAKKRIPGLLDATFSLGLIFDGAGGAEDSTLAAGLGTAAAFEFRANSGAVGAGNPKYTGTAILTKYDVSGSLTEAVQAAAEFHITDVVTRATS